MLIAPGRFLAPCEEIIFTTARKHGETQRAYQMFGRGLINLRFVSAIYRQNNVVMQIRPGRPIHSIFRARCRTLF
jgi:hypothetical protein